MGFIFKNLYLATALGGRRCAHVPDELCSVGGKRGDLGRLRVRPTLERFGPGVDHGVGGRRLRSTVVVVERWERVECVGAGDGRDSGGRMVAHERVRVRMSASM